MSNIRKFNDSITSLTELSC